MVRIGFSDTPVEVNDQRLLEDDVVFDFASQSVVIKNKRLNFSQLKDELDPETADSLTSLSTLGINNLVNKINEQFDLINSKLGEQQEFVHQEEFKETDAEEDKIYYILKD